MDATQNATQNLDPSCELLQRLIGSAAPHVVLETKPLRGGLVSSSVLHVAVHGAGTHRPKMTRFVAKQLPPGSQREAEIYGLLRAAGTHELAPVSFGVGRGADAGAWLYLEAVAACSRWPWRDVEHARRVLEALAVLHVRTLGVALEADGWDYEAELRERAELTLEHAERRVVLTGDPLVRASLPGLRRLVMQLPAVRERLLGLQALPPTLLHGDVHSGNVVVRKRKGRYEPVLLDWGRARIGSPLEDVSSWLQSLGFWEPAVKRKHDTLLAAYLRARGLPAPASREIRDAYWLGAASNGLAGALYYQLDVAMREGSTPAGDSALRAAHDWLRVIRRADLRYRARDVRAEA